MLEEVLVYVGTVTFAVTGAPVAVQKRFDLVGVLVLAAVTAIGGGSIRDLVAGIIPPASLTNEPLLWLVFATGLLVFALHRSGDLHPSAAAIGAAAIGRTVADTVARTPR